MQRSVLGLAAGFFCLVASAQAQGITLPVLMHCKRHILARSAARQPKSNQLPAVRAIGAFVYLAYAYLEKDA